MNGPFEFDAIVVGAGHAGIEAALALSRKGHSTLILCISLDSVGLLACNPSIGGTAKGHIVREIDALGGEMGRAADKTMLSLKMLNKSKGAAVQSLRAQIDKYKYHSYMKACLENQKNLTLRQGEAKELIVKDGKAAGVLAANGIEYSAKKIVLACGVYLRSRTITGENIEDKGPSGLSNAKFLSDSLKNCGIGLRRFKTGTPARVHRDSINLSVLEEQIGEGDTYSFSHLSGRVNYDKVRCYLGYTNLHTHEVIRQNIHLAPMYSGVIESVGARYCPSIEDKIVRFAGKERHQFFLEPEGESTKEMYVQGISTSLPAKTQLEVYKTIAGFENVKIMRDAYAIEYDCIDPTTLLPSLESKTVNGLYFAGQINGTSGYEEAAGQGLMAGLNAALALEGRPPVILRRDQAYIGVLIDDLVTKGTNEPYRMMTSRAEYRLMLRQDNADMRLTEIGFEAGLADKKRLGLLKKKKAELDKIEELFCKVYTPAIANALFSECGETTVVSGITLEEIFKRSGVSAQSAVKYIPELSAFSMSAVEEALIQKKYEGYLKRQERTIREQLATSERELPDIDYLSVKGLRIEAAQKLNRIRPKTIGQASRVSGVNPADINVLIMLTGKKEK